MKFKEYSFKDLLVEIVDNRGKTCPTAETGVPLIATNCIKNDSLYPVFEKVRYVDQDTYDNWFRGHPEPGDMIFVCKGSPGRVAWVPDPINFCIAQDMVAIRADITKVYPKYLFALLHSEETQKKILNMHVGTLIPHFKKGDFGNLYFDIPEDLEYQKIVGDAYFDFCKIIELNRQTNQTLEQIAQAIFKSWFVDFEPVKAKAQVRASVAEGKMTGSDQSLPKNFDVEAAVELAAMCAISGKTEEQLKVLDEAALQQLKTTAALFPDALVESELGEIPEGWEVKLNGDVMDVRDGTHDSPKQSETGYPLVTSKHITTGALNLKDAYLISEEDYENVNKRSNVEQGDILLTMIGTVGYPYLVIQPEIKFAIKNIGLFRTSEVVELRSYFYLLLKSKGMQQYLEARMAGTTQKYLSLKTLRSIEMILPPHKILSVFKGVVEPLLNKVFDGLGENESLSNIRDALLPKMLAGDIQLNEVHEAM